MFIHKLTTAMKTIHSFKSQFTLSTYWMDKERKESLLYNIFQMKGGEIGLVGKQRFPNFYFRWAHTRAGAWITQVFMVQMRREKT